jgi:bifunctional DNA-binding transcriptional regulator/antitoxin component of YhaV-PrlF toxin-antitoxin module
MSAHLFLTLQGRGLLALPADLRRRHRLDEPGAQVEIVERDDGIIELRPHTAVPAAQDWFWTERWQAMEREVDEHVSGGEVTTHETGDDFLGHLGRLETDT